ncbi:hypothetical protein HMSSN036_91940 [Paenibacillus macerans]|nr:hypothetical protein HMSSN036_91940 [Paenibacillus macerans]
MRHGIAGELLSQMKSSQLRQRSEELAARLLNDPLVWELRSSHPELEQQQLMRGMAKLYQYVNDRRHCENCPGLANCPNDFPGHYTKLAVEQLGGKPELVDLQVPCGKQLQYERELSVKKRIHSFYVDERALEEGYSEVEIMSKDSLRAPAVAQVFRYINEIREQGLKPRGLYLEGHFGTGKNVPDVLSFARARQRGIFRGDCVYARIRGRAEVDAAGQRQAA